MKQETAIYVDVLRIVAAGAVFMQHSYYFTGEVWGKAFSQFGADAVAVFFVISGFVIAFSAFRRPLRATDYIVARVRRLYTVAIPAVILTLALDYVGRNVDGSGYYGRTWYNASTNIYDVFRYLTFSNEYWGSHVVVGSDEPFWSIGYEANYYILFGLFVFLKKPRWIGLLSCILLAAVFGPNIILYLPLWSMGAGLYFLVAQRSPFADHLPRSIWFLIYLSSCVLLYFWHRHTGSMHEKFNFSFIHVARAFYFYGLGVIVSLNLWSFSSIAQRGMPYFVLAKRPIRWLAGGTFTLYLVHQPILLCLGAFFPNTSGSVARAVAIQGGALGICFLLSELFERRSSQNLAIAARLILPLWRIYFLPAWNLRKSG